MAGGGFFSLLGTAFLNGWNAANAAFRDTYLGVASETEYSAYVARNMRYKVLWAMYENSAYRNLHNWAKSYKVAYGLYRYIRAIYNPSYRLGEFWKAHLLAGKLDPDAGDGEAVPSALPIITDNEALRPAIAALWRASNWQILKDILSLRTSIMGDGVLQVMDDPVREKVYLKYTNPMTIRDATFDEFGNIKGYIIQEQRIDPESINRMVTYTERAFRSGDNVVYQTYRNGQLFAWDGDSAEWQVPYGFVPMVWIQHNNVGFDFGQSEIYPGLSKFREVDDVASKLSDQIRKLVDAPLFFSGVAESDLNMTTPSAANPDANKPEAGRETTPALFAPDPQAKVTPIVADLKINDTVAYLQDILRGIEADYPELSDNLKNVSGDISGRAIRLNRSPVEDKVLMRRPNYDDAIVRAQQMAVAIGGWRGYEGYQGFDLDSFNAGKLDHSIGDRPVFRPDPVDDLEKDQLFWEVAGLAEVVDVPLDVFLKQHGWPQERIDEIVNSEQYQQKLKVAKAAADAAASVPPFPTTTDRNSLTKTSNA